MTKTRAWLIGAGVVVLGGVLAFVLYPRAQFVVGGAMVNVGYRLQDRLASYDLVHDEAITPEQIWAELSRQNELASDVRGVFPRSVRHPVVAIVACMDGRIDTNELVGDTRRYYYVVRTAGSVLAAAEQEMLELAVKNGVRVILLTTHTDCAAEAAAASDEQRAAYPALISLLDEREARIAEFSERPAIRQAVAEGRLLIKRARIDTETERLVLDDHDHAP